MVARFVQSGRVIPSFEPAGRLDHQGASESIALSLKPDQGSGLSDMP
jgi:hypothetical protein